MLLYTHLIYVLQYSIFYDQCALNCASQQPLYVLYISCSLALKREISQTITFFKIMQMNLWKDRKEQLQILLIYLRASIAICFI